VLDRLVQATCMAMFRLELRNRLNRRCELGAQPEGVKHFV
jgi:hypothetical protein